MTNTHEAAARQRKVDRLVRALDEMSRQVNGGDPNSLEFAQQTLSAAQTFNANRWEALAFVARVKNPSAATRSAVMAHLEGRVEARSKPPIDPFHGTL